MSYRTVSEHKSISARVRGWDECAGIQVSAPSSACAFPPRAEEL